MREPKVREAQSRSDSTLKKVLALKLKTMDQLRDQWRELFECEPPSFNRKNLEARLAYRIQELALGGLSDATRERLEAIGEREDGGLPRIRSRKHEERPVIGTRLIREWQGEEHIVTVTQHGFNWRGRPYKSLSAVARAITGTRWNGWIFFGLKRQGGSNG